MSDGVPEQFLPDGDANHCLGEGDWTCSKCGVETGGYSVQPPGNGAFLCNRCYIASCEKYGRADRTVECCECSTPTNHLLPGHGFVCPTCMEVFTVERGERR